MRLLLGMSHAIAGRLSPRKPGWGWFALSCLVVCGAGGLALNRWPGSTVDRAPPESKFNHAHLLKSMVAHARLSDGHVPGSMLSGLALKLKKGLPAPEFTLPTIRDHGGISLSSFLGRPVVLVFGSFSCSVFHDRISQINEFYRANRDRAAFLFVSVTEAGHRIPGFEFVLDSIDPDTLGNRRERVGEAMQRMGLSFPGVLDIGETA